MTKPHQLSNAGAPVKPAAKPKRHERISLRQLLHLVRRICIFLAAVAYIKLSFDLAIAAVGLLRGRDDPLLPTNENTFNLIARFVGAATLRESRLVEQALGGSTVPLNGTLYLHSLTETSLSMCRAVPVIQRSIYEDTFLRSVYDAVTGGVSYQITDLATATTELIAPVVDCTTSDALDGDASTSRLFFLTRQRATPSNVSLVVISLANQPYEIVAQHEQGSAGVAMIQVIEDMRMQSVATHYAVSIGYPFEEFNFRAYEYLHTTADGFRALQSIPADDTELVRLVLTASRSGFYIKAESEQSNVNVELWLPDTDPMLCIARWRWQTKPKVADSWAWVHVIQCVIGLKLFLHLMILCLATFHNLRGGKWWLGDAFVAISTAQHVNGVAVLLSWFMNEYWVLHEFSFYTAYEVSGATNIFVDTGPLQAGMLTMYLSACGIIGLVFREKVDPMFAMACYALGFESRIAIIRAIPSLRVSISDFGKYSYMRGMLDADDEVSPMRMWTTHPIGTRNYGFVFQCLFPIYSTLGLVVVYVLARKGYRHVVPEVPRGITIGSAPPSASNEPLVARKRVLTLFEVATGAELENRFGVVSDYETCLFIKGMKFASADGIYSTGFVIVNRKWLLATDDYWSIVLMKLSRRRYRNIFLYEVDGSTVQQTARLVYPHTLAFRDLVLVNVSVLT